MSRLVLLCKCRHSSHKPKILNILIQKVCILQLKLPVFFKTIPRTVQKKLEKLFTGTPCVFAHFKIIK